MNIAALAQLIAGGLIILASVPLIGRKVPRNYLYGIRTPFAFESDQNWYDINAYGGRLTLFWGVSIVLFAGLGLTISKQHWGTHSALSLIPILGGGVMVVVQVLRYGKRRSNQAL